MRFETEVRRLNDELRDMENELNMERYQKKSGAQQDKDRIAELEK